MLDLFGDSSRGGEWAAVRLRVNDDGDGDGSQRIVQADAPGLASDLVGLTLLEAAAVPGETLAADALANAIGPELRAPANAERIAVGMSGGVDSAVALLKAGPQAVGVTLRLWIDPQAADAERACCSPSAVIAARELCHARGLPHVTLDLREEFREAVVEPFVEGYAAGETPNPCIRCNGSFRFRELLAFADRVGATRLATGHYARIIERDGDGRPLLARAADPTKDQSYMLAQLDEASLRRLWFPLGDQTKDETRAQASAAGLAAARRPESQEACFLGGGDYRQFLERHGLAARPGSLVDESGHEVGAHDGFWRFTPGQRRGLGVAAAEPLYAITANATTNTVVVGTHDALARRRVAVTGSLYATATRVEAKLRYRSPSIAASVEPTPDGFELILDEPAYGVAHGQAAVLYERDAVVGSGLITSTSAE